MPGNVGRAAHHRKEIDVIWINIIVALVVVGALYCVVLLQKRNAYTRRKSDR